jgi:hypothetical protein
MNIGEYFIAAGTILGFVFRTGVGSQVASFLTQVGAALEAGTGTVGPITVGNEQLTVTISPKG